MCQQSRPPRDGGLDGCWAQRLRDRSASGKHEAAEAPTSMANRHRSQVRSLACLAARSAGAGLARAGQGRDQSCVHGPLCTIVQR